MNLVKLIQDQVSGDALGKLSALIGADGETTERATSAAVPAILSSLAGLASSDAGAKKLAGAIGNFDAGGIGNFAQLLGGGDAGSLLQKSQGLFGSLLGDGLTGSIASAVSRFAGLDSALTKKLLAYVMPLVLKVVGSQWQTRGGTTAALTNMFAEQKQHIADAIPAGLSLPQIPGWNAATDAARAVADTGRRTAEAAGKAQRSAASWAIPLLLAAAAGFLLWNIFGREREVAQVPAPAAASKSVTAMRPTLPDLPATPTTAQLTAQFGDIATSIKDTFATIKDANSADAAAPQLEELRGKLDSFETTISQLPESSRAALKSAFQDRFADLKTQATEKLAQPGVSDRIRALIRQIVQKLEDLEMISRTN